MNNPLDKAPFDINSLIPYAEFNWDTIQGLDRVVKDVNIAQSRITTGVAKNITKVQNVVKPVVMKIATVQANNVKSLTNAVANVQDNVKAVIGANVARVAADVPAPAKDCAVDATVTCPDGQVAYAGQPCGPI